MNRVSVRVSRRLSVVAAFALAAISIVSAQAPTVTLTVNVAAQRKPISPYIYGLNFAKPSFASEIGLPVQRWGGNHTTRYNYLLNAMNHGSDWFFHNNNHYDAFTFADQTADQWITQNANTGTDSLITVPMTGYVASDTNQSTCGFNKAKYPVQDNFDVGSGFPNCGDGLNGGVPIAGNDPFDTSVAVTETFTNFWASHLVATHGAAGAGGVRFYALDNEPGLWHETHRDVHPAPFTYDESFNRGSAYAAAIKTADPNAMVLGPVQDGWTRYFYASYQDSDNGAGAIADRSNHGDTEFVLWYLQQMQAYEQAHPGHRLLDYLDLHAYPQADNVSLSPAGTAALQALRLRSTRALWDATYVDESWIADAGPDNGIIRLIPRMHDWVNNAYPGTKLALTEYNWGGLEHINGALAQADILGIFGREGVDLATLWNFPDSSNGLGYDHFETLPGAYVFRMYRNYDGAGSQFGDTSVSAASTNQAQLSVFAAQRTADSALTLMIVNKTPSTNITAAVNIAGFTSGPSAQVFRYSNSNLNAIVALPNQAVAGNSFTATFPSNSITLVLMPSQGAAPPLVVTGAADTITATSAVLHGTANPNGDATTAGFAYGSTAAYGSATPSQSLGSGSVAVSIGGGSIVGLTCNTTYHFRATATNASGSTNGNDATFTTALCPVVIDAKATVPGARKQFNLADDLDRSWSSIETVGGRSYCAQVTAAPTEHGRTTATVIALRADGVTTLAGGVPGAAQACFVAPASETVFFGVMQSDAGPRSHLLEITETTLWANWFYIGGDYSSYAILRNTTESTVNATIVWRAAASGDAVGTLSVPVPPHGVAYYDARANTIPGSAAGSIEVGHDGEPQALVGSATTISATTGLSFDTIFMQRRQK